MIDWKTVLATVGRYVKVLIILGGICVVIYSIFLGVDLMGKGNHPAWLALQTELAKHMGRYLGMFGVVYLAAVSTMPETRPKSLDEAWTWLRDTLQAATPARFAHKNPNPQSQETKQ